MGKIRYDSNFFVWWRIIVIEAFASEDQTQFFDF